MSKLLLEFLIKLVAILANTYPNILFDNVREFVKIFLLRDFSQDVIDENLSLLTENYNRYSGSARSSKVGGFWLEAIIIEINRSLSRKQKYLIIKDLLLFEKIFIKHSTSLENDQNGRILDSFAKKFKLNEDEFLNCRSFIFEKLYEISNKDNLLLVASHKIQGFELNFMQHDNLVGLFFFQYIESVNIILFYYKGNGLTYLNQDIIYPEQIYVFGIGNSIKGTEMAPLDYNMVLKKFLLKQKISLSLVSDNIEYKFRNSNNGIKQFNLVAETGCLVGIMGRSGVGKSTLLNILNGNIIPQQGTVTINGYDIYEKNSKLDGVIGYVPQDDLLISELSVFLNLYFSARLCFKDLSESDLVERINNLLIELNLYDVKDLKVGTPLNKLISGGQRKKLNLALELIRQPWILFADEPTSGLSSSDAEEIMQHMVGQTMRGRIVVVNIHQPSSDIYKLFDKIIVLDKEGYLAFVGNPVEAIIWFNEAAHRHTSSSEICHKCENVNPEAIFKVIEEKKINEFGDFASERKTSPAEWQKMFYDKHSFKNKTVEIPLPQTKMSILSPLKQFLIFSKRNLLTKLANKQYIALALLVSPILAVMLSFLCKYNGLGQEYSFAHNDNISPYLFMSVIVSIFVGLILSAEEIFRDKKILYRESFLRLSKLSYLHSKILYSFALSAIQTLVYVLIGNAILELHGMIFYFWLILFASSCFANLLGLLISSMLNSAVAIYILVPLVIVPQLLLSGTIVEYKKLNEYFSTKEVTPVIGDIMVSRWAYEALIIAQFEYNDYQKKFFEIEKKESNLKFDYLFVIPEIEKAMSDTIMTSKNETIYKKNDFIIYQIQLLNKKYPSGLLPSDLNGNLNSDKIEMINRYNTKLKSYLSTDLNKIMKRKDSVTNSLIALAGSNANLVKLKNKYHNNSVADLVLKQKQLQSFSVDGNKIIRDFEPVYQIANSKIGRSHFMASSKNIGNFVIDTWLFNLIAICFLSVLIYLFLLFYLYIYFK